MINKPNLEMKKPVGNGVSTPEYQNGPSNFAKVSTADMKNTGTDLNQTASGENLSAKFKNPRAKADVAPEAQNQYQQP